MFATSFIENMRGYFLNEAIAAQTVSEERLQWTLETGGLLWDPASERYVERLERVPREIIKSPFVMGVSRETEKLHRGTWIGALFEYTPPRCGFSSAEQEVLQAALRAEGSTDEELASALRLSVSTVKKIWASVYSRAAAGLPELISDHSRSDHDATQRGSEKRRRILA